MIGSNAREMKSYLGILEDRLLCELLSRFIFRVEF